MNTDYETVTARITAVHKERYGVRFGETDTFARLKTREYFEDGETFPTVGDYVVMEHVPSGDSRIIATCPRKTLFSRRDPGPVPREQPVAANFDYVFIL